MTDTVVQDVERERRIASLNVAVSLLQHRDITAEKLRDIVGFIYGWTAATPDPTPAADAKPPSIAENIPGAREVPGKPNFAIVDGGKPMTPPIRKPAEVQKGEQAVEPPSDTPV